MRLRGSLLSVVANVSWILVASLLLLPVEMTREHPWIEVARNMGVFVFACACVGGFARAVHRYKTREESDQKDAEQ